MGFRRVTCGGCGPFTCCLTDKSQKHQQPVGNLISKTSATACGRIGRSKSATACGRNPVGTYVWLLENIEPDSAPPLGMPTRPSNMAGRERCSRTTLKPSCTKREGKAVTTFKRTLPPPQSDLAEQTLKDPYNFDFLTLHMTRTSATPKRVCLTHIQETSCARTRRWLRVCWPAISHGNQRPGLLISTCYFIISGCGLPRRD